MKVRIAIALIALATMAGCKSKSAFNYSEKIVKMEKDLGPDIEKADAQMAKFIETQTYDSVAIIAARMETLVEGKISEIKSTEPPAVEKADNFKRAAIRFFTFMKNMYTAYKNFASQTNEEEREKERQKLVDLATQIETAVKEMQKAQKEYADANNFKIKPD
jgi:hypothetical protein